MKLEEEGIFKVIPQSWSVVDSKSTQSRGINIAFEAVARFRGGEWQDIGPDAPVVFGTWYVIGADGKPRIKVMEELAEHLGWVGFQHTRNSVPPEKTVQVTVKAETYEGTTRYKAAWLKPEDADPLGGFGLDEDACAALDKKYAKALATVTGKKSKRDPIDDALWP